MIETSRRGFLGMMLAAASAPAIVRADSLMKVLPSQLVLWGDGIHDDTKALQAFFDGANVYAKQGIRAVNYGRNIEIVGGTFIVSETLTIVGRSLIASRVNLKSSRLIEGPMLRIYRDGELSGSLSASNKGLY